MAALRLRSPSVVVRFALYGGVVTLLAVAAGSWLARANATSRARADVSTDAAFLAGRLGRDDLSRNAFLWPRRNPGLTSQLDDFLDPRNAAQDAVRVALATPDGIVTYASDHRGVGSRLGRIPGGAHVVRRDGRRVVETWVPVTWVLDPSKPRGYLAFDRDYAPVAAQIREATLLEAGTLTLAVALLYLAMLPIMHRLTGNLRRALLERKRLAAIVESSNDAIVGRDANGRITSWNAAAEHLYGWSEAEALGRSIEFLVPLAKPGELDELAGTRELHLRKDGRLVMVSVSVSPIRDDGGALAGSSLIVRDVTLVANLEKELREAQRQEAVARFATAIANELDGLVADLAPTDAGARGIELVQRLREFGHAAETNPEPLDLNRLLVSLHGPLDAQLGSAVELSLDAAAPQAWVLADPKHLRRVVLDLALSARDAMPGGGRIEIGTSDGENGVVLSVADTGTVPHAERMGLGLATVFGVVARSGGSLEVDSRPGAGTTVRMLLPRAEPRAVAA